MARIIYAVAGEGYGHASRAHLIGQRLLDAGHDVIFATSHRALLYLRECFGPRAQELFGLTFDYSKGYVAPVATVWKNLWQFPHGRRANKELFNQVYKPFRPDLLITDFEPFSAWWAWRNRVPFLSVNNEHTLIFCRLEHDLRNVVQRLQAGVVTRFHYFGAEAYVIINFFQAPLKRDKAVLTPPIVRRVITELTPTDAGHITIYWTTGTGEDRLRDVLIRFPGQRFHIYGFNKQLECGNCLFKERSTEGFLADLASSRGVVASAGFSLISECLYLKKRMLLLPLGGHYEQLLNAHYVDRLGLGVWSRDLDEPAVSHFLQRIDEPFPQDDRILWPDNERFFEIFRGVLAGLGGSSKFQV
ncbi:MAG TPA: glycosyltransferase family protein [Sedimentisphaerales bacterium]|nr:glycosyltransferase family protein [Sedimentisphaerales bacterium]